MASVVELGAQLHLKMEDGSMIVIQTPPLAPPDGTSIDQIREKIMGFGEDLTASMRAKAMREMGLQQDDPRILLARGGLKPFVEGG